MLKLVDEHRFRGRDKKAWICDRGCPSFRAVQVEHGPVELSAEPR